MSKLPPDDYIPDQMSGILEASQTLLANRHQAVVAMSSGGCARYAFSMDVDFCLDRKGYPLIHYSSDNAHHHLIVTNSTMDFRLVHELSPDGVELSLLIFTGMLALVNPGDHDSIDRHSRYFNANVENYSRGSERLYRFVPSQARLESASGRHCKLPLSEMIRRNIWTPAEESSLIDCGNDSTDDKPENGTSVRFAGVDECGADIIDGSSIRRLPFRRPTRTLSDAKRALIELTLQEAGANP